MKQWLLFLFSEIQLFFSYVFILFFPPVKGNIAVLQKLCWKNWVLFRCWGIMLRKTNRLTGEVLATAAHPVLQDVWLHLLHLNAYRGDVSSWIVQCEFARGFVVKIFFFLSLFYLFFFPCLQKARRIVAMFYSLSLRETKTSDPLDLSCVWLLDALKVVVQTPDCRQNYCDLETKHALWEQLHWDNVFSSKCSETVSAALIEAIQWICFFCFQQDKNSASVFDSFAEFELWSSPRCFSIAVCKCSSLIKNYLCRLSTWEKKNKSVLFCPVAWTMLSLWRRIPSPACTRACLSISLFHWRAIFRQRWVLK